MARLAGLQEDADKITYEVFSILEANFLFGGDQNLWIPKQISETRGRICILSVDGGGMPGATSAEALSYLETVLRNKSGNPHSTIADYFDVAAGTGVGGIFTAMLFASKDGTCPIFQADETGRFLADAKDSGKRRGGGLLRQLLRRKSSTSESVLATALKAAFRDEKTGRSLTLKDTLKPILIPCYDLSSGAAPFLFSRADALESDSFDFALWEVCCATTAEPGFNFNGPPVCIKSADGSARCVAVGGRVGAMSNPTAAAMTHVLHNKQEFPFVRGAEDMIVVSIGGDEDRGGLECEQVKKKKWKGEEWVRAVGRISGESSGELVDQAVAMAFGESRARNYVRIHQQQQQGKRENEEEEMLKARNVESVLLGGKRIGEQTNAEKLEWVAEQLVLEHRQRSDRIAPTVSLKSRTPLPTPPYTKH